MSDPKPYTLSDFDALRAEVERLEAALRDVAKRQRAACAKEVRPCFGGCRYAEAVRATPLVTEGGE